MMSPETLTAFFGWLTVVNMGIYVLTAIGVFAFRGFMVRMNARLFGLGEEQIMAATFNYVANFKLAIILFAFAPWLALTLMG
jgi:hypothetical protein